MSAIAHLEQSLGAEQAVLLAYSGGLDSCVLLHQLTLLRQLRPDLRVRALHIHHGLNPLADEWVEHCRQQCARWHVPLEVVRVTLDVREGGVEAAARAARYQALQQHLLPDEALLTAQHLDDQSETVMLALKRGSGPAGLAAMPRRHQRGTYRHLRPLLSLSRQQLEAWAQQHQLNWIEDDSNQDPRYDRNFLRLQVLPVLNARWPHFSAAVARSAELCGEQEQLLDELLGEALEAMLDDQGSLGYTPLLTMSDARRFALLRRWIASQGGSMPSRDGLRRLWQEGVLSREDAAPRLRFGNAEVRRYRDRLWWLPVMHSLREHRICWQAPWQPLPLPNGLGQLEVGDSGMALRQPLPQEVVSVRFQAQGNVHIVGRAGGRPLKKIWHELQIPPWLRERTPLIFYDDRLIAAAGVFITRDGSPAPHLSSWCICWNQKSDTGGQDE